MWFQPEASRYRDRDRLLVTFSLATGMRPGEVQALRWEDCDLGAGTVARSSVARGLVAYRARQAKHRLKRRTQRLEYADHGLVLAARNGEPLDAKNLAFRTLKPILRAAGLPEGFRWYDCRHTCATLLLAAGENPKVVSERLGHATVAFTLDRYAHVLPGMQEAASNRLEGLLYGVTP